jgi:hypothetical protein
MNEWYNVAMRGNASHRPSISTPDLARRYKSGDSLETIARAVGLTYLAVRYRLLKAGIKMRPRNCHRSPSNKKPISTETLANMYASGLSANAVGAAVGLSTKAVLDRFKRAGVPRRARSDYKGLCVGEANANWRGGRSLLSSGYAMVQIDGRRKFEHRVVMEKVLGRSLTRDEHVHHMNGVRDDNRPENLVVLDASTHKREGATLAKALQARIRELEHRLGHSENDLGRDSGRIV